MFEVEFSLQFMLDECDNNINNLHQTDIDAVIGAIKELSESKRTHWCDAFGLDTETFEILEKRKCEDGLKFGELHIHTSSTNTGISKFNQG